MQERRIAQLTQILSRKPGAGPRATRQPFDATRQRERAVRDAKAMARRRRITLFNRHDGSMHKAFEQLLNILVETAVFQTHRRLRGQGAQQFDIRRTERQHLLGHMRYCQRHPSAWFAVNEL